MSVPVAMLAQAPASSPGSAARSMHTAASAPVPAQASSPAPDRERSRKHSPGSGSGSKKNGSGSGLLPSIPGIQWEHHAKGGFEAWHGSPGAHRKERTYIAYVNPKRLEGSPDEIERLVRMKAQGKGIEL